MHFSLELPTPLVDHPEAFVSADAIREVTQAAAAAGFAAVNVTDHPAPDARWLDHGGHHALDPFVALSFAAAADPEIRLHTNIYVAGYRNPFLGAQSIHSLDVLSGGRVILGVAAGYLKPEFAAVGADFERRGALLDEALEVLGAVSTGDDVAWQGNGFSSRGVRLRPVAPSGRRPPVWVGGNSRAAMRRAVRHDGWSPFHTGGYSQASRTAAIESLADLAAAIEQVRELRAAEGIATPFDICWSEALMSDGSVSVDERASRIADLAAAGVTWVTVTLTADDRSALISKIAAFGRDLIRDAEPA